MQCQMVSIYGKTWYFCSVRSVHCLPTTMDTRYHESVSIFDVTLVTNVTSCESNDMA